MSNNQVTMEAQRQSAILSHNLKDQARNLATEYNTKTDLRNQQEKILNKYDQYLTLQNEKLNKELQELKNIESHIATRDALVRGNQSEYEKKQKRIHVLKVFFVVIAYLIFVVIAFLGKKISLAFLMTNLIAVLFIYSLYVAWVYNLLFVKSFTKYVESDLDKMRREIYKEGRKIEDDINQYINGNCDCPLKNGKTNGGKIPKIPSKYHPPGILPRNDGIYYYDGSAPQERLYPLIPNLSTKEENYNPDNYNNKKENPYGFEIDWEVSSNKDDKMIVNNTVSKTCNKKYNKMDKDNSNYWTVDL